MTTAIARAKRRADIATNTPARKSKGLPAVAKTPRKSAAEPLPPTLEIFALDHELSLPADLTSLDRFRDWVHSDQYPERGRFSFLNGAIVIDMSPENVHTHAVAKHKIAVAIDNWLDEHLIGKVLPDGTMLVNKKAKLSTEPDMMVCCWDSLRSGRVRIAERTEGSGNCVEVVGSPDIVVEVVSPSSVRKDTQRLPPLYLQAGIREFWLVDARGDSVQFTIHRRGKRDWLAVDADNEGFVRSDVLGGSFRLDRDTDVVGDFRYRLKARG